MTTTAVDDVALVERAPTPPLPAPAEIVVVSTPAADAASLQLRRRPRSASAASATHPRQHHAPPPHHHGEVDLTDLSVIDGEATLHVRAYAGGGTSAYTPELFRPHAAAAEDDGAGSDDGGGSVASDGSYVMVDRPEPVARTLRRFVREHGKVALLMAVLVVSFGMYSTESVIFGVHRHTMAVSARAAAVQPLRHEEHVPEVEVILVQLQALFDVGELYDRVATLPYVVVSVQHSTAEPWEPESVESGWHGARQWAPVVEAAPWTVTFSDDVVDEETPVHYHKWVFPRPLRGHVRIRVHTNAGEPIPVMLRAQPMGGIGRYREAIAGGILVCVFAMIAFDVVHRTIAAMIGSFAVLGVLGLMGDRPDLETVFSWVDIETTALLFGMMVLVGVFATTGFFEWLAVRTYILAAGNFRVVITLLVVMTAAVSAFLDNVTTILLITPVTLQLCEVMDQEPRPVVIAVVLFSNIGGAATAVGDPPNVMLASAMQSYGVTFTDFIVNLGPIVIICVVASLAVLHAFLLLREHRTDGRGRYRELQEVDDDAEDAAVAAAAPIAAVTGRVEPDVSGSEDDDDDDGGGVVGVAAAEAGTAGDDGGLEAGGAVLSAERVGRAAAATTTATQADAGFARTAERLRRAYPIHNPVLFWQCSVVLLVVLLLFLLDPVTYIEMSWVPLFGATAMLILLDPKDLEPILDQIEWGTLIFFATLSVLMRGIDHLGFIRYFGSQVSSTIEAVDEESRLETALTLIVFVSALVSAFIDNVPFTAAMVPVILQLSRAPLELPLRPMVWALSLGACFGGNGTLIGASANVVASGICERMGLPVTFMNFFRYGMPIMLLTLTLAAVYLWFVYVYLGFR